MAVDKCKCGATRGMLGQMAASSREQARLASRCNHKKGRQLNSVAGLAVSLVPRSAGHAMFDEAAHRLAVQRESVSLQREVGGSAHMTQMLGLFSIIEGFLAVHYVGRHSIMQDAQRAQGIDATVVAEFFNTVGPRAAPRERSKGQ